MPERPHAMTRGAELPHRVPSDVAEGAGDQHALLDVKRVARDALRRDTLSLHSSTLAQDGGRRHHGPHAAASAPGRTTKAYESAGSSSLSPESAAGANAGGVPSAAAWSSLPFSEITGDPGSAAVKT